MAEESFTVSLRVWHPSLSDEEVIQVLNLAPEVRQSVGAPRVNPAGHALDGVYRSTYCSFLLVGKTLGIFTDSIEELLSPLHSHGDFFRRISDERGRAELFVGVFAETSTGFTLDTKSMLAMASSSLELSVEIYC